MSATSSTRRSRRRNAKFDSSNFKKSSDAARRRVRFFMRRLLSFEKRRLHENCCVRLVKTSVRFFENFTILRSLSSIRIIILFHIAGNLISVRAFDRKFVVACQQAAKRGRLTAKKRAYRGAQEISLLIDLFSNCGRLTAKKQADRGACGFIAASVLERT